MWAIGCDYAEVDLDNDPRSDGLGTLLADARTASQPAVVLHASTPTQSETVVAGRVQTDQPTLAQPGHLFRLASVSKTWVAVAVLQQVEAGDMDLDAPIGQYLPTDVAGQIANTQTATVRQVLGMRSGMAEYLENDFFLAIEANPTRTWTPRQALQYAQGQPAAFTPGTRFEYVNTNYLLLHLALEQVTGQPLHQVLRAQILDPVGATATFTQGAESYTGTLVHGYEDWDENGSVDDTFNVNDGFGIGDGALVANAADVARFYRALFDEKSLLGEAMLAELLSDPEGDEYGLGIEVTNDGGVTQWGHSGGVLGFTTDVRYRPANKTLVVLLHADVDLDDAMVAAAFRTLD
ncbi:MAG: serine hydrolase domain-containing protein [Rhodothermales bacterium]